MPSMFCALASLTASRTLRLSSSEVACSNLPAVLVRDMLQNEL